MTSRDDQTLILDIDFDHSPYARLFAQSGGQIIDVIARERPERAVVSPEFASLLDEYRSPRDWPLAARPGFVTEEPLGKRARRRARGRGRRS
jgi:hypothetical protein